MFIPCSQSCRYQSDGCCRLSRASAMTGCDQRFCPHYQQPENEILLSTPKEIILPPSERFSPQEPQRLL